MKHLLLCACTLLLACGRTDSFSRQRSPDDGGVVHPPDPLQGVWQHDQDVPGVYLNRQLSFADGTWKTQILYKGGNGLEDRQVDIGTYVIAGTTVKMKTTASSCQSLAEVTNPQATFERHGNKMTMFWQSDSASALPPETLYLARITTLSDLGTTGCNVTTVGSSSVFLPNPVTPVP